MTITPLTNRYGASFRRNLLTGSALPSGAIPPAAVVDSDRA